jgi:hypothetical protein
MNRNVIFAAITTAVLALVALSNGQQTAPPAAPEIASTPVIETILPKQAFAPDVALAETARFEMVDNWAGTKRGERLAPATPEQLASLPGPAPHTPAATPLTADERIEFAATIPDAVDLLDGLTAPRIDTVMAFAQPDRSSATVVQASSGGPPGAPGAAAQAIVSTFRGLAERIEQGPAGALLGYN